MSKENIRPLTAMSSCMGQRLWVPFEWFDWDALRLPKKDKDTSWKTNSAVLVLWLNADLFEDHAAKRLAQLIWRIRDAVTKTTPHPIVQFK
jgi:hypothetical protein